MASEFFPFIQRNVSAGPPLPGSNTPLGTGLSLPELLLCPPPTTSVFSPSLYPQPSWIAAPPTLSPLPSMAPQPPSPSSSLCYVPASWMESSTAMASQSQLQSVYNVPPPAYCANSTRRTTPKSSSPPAGSATTRSPTPGELQVRDACPKALPANCRPAKFAGKRYPANAAALESLIKQGLQQGFCPIPAKIVLIPHAPMETCMAIVAAAARSIPESTDHIVVIAPAHKRHSSMTAVTAYESMETPLGVAKVDVAKCAVLKNSRLFDVMTSAADLDEYSVETILPFLQTAAPHALITPIYVGLMPRKQAKTRAKILAKLIKAKGTVVIATCDFGHWGAKYGWTKIDPEFGTGDAAIRATIARLDLRLIEVISTCNPSAVAKSPLGSSICGHDGLVLALYAAKYAGLKLTANLMSHGIYAAPDHTFQGHASVVFNERSS
eukprot:m51a1_g9439 hypothetical protein (438) ;mRNA; r:444019-445643